MDFRFFSKNFLHLFLLQIIAHIITATGESAVTGLSYFGLGGDPTQYCVNVPFRLTLSPQETTDTIISVTSTPVGYCACAAKLVDTKKFCDLKCSRSQTYAIMVATTNGAVLEMQIKIDNCQDLYGWFAVAVVPSVVGSPDRSPDGSPDGFLNGPVVIDKDWISENLTIRLWIQGGQYAPASELRASSPTNVQINQYSSVIASPRTATIPSTGDATVTKIFRRMALSPRLQTNFRDQNDVFFFCNPAIAPIFDFTFGFFMFSCQRTANDRYGYYSYKQNSSNRKNQPVELTFQQKVKVFVSGKPDYFGYTVADNILTLSRPKFTNLVSGSSTTLTWKGVTSLRYEPCNTNFAIGFSFSETEKIFFTNDEFETFDQLKITLGTLVSATLIEVQVTKSFIYFLVDDGSLYALNKAFQNGVAKLITPKLQGKLKGLKVPEWCTNPSNDFARDAFVVWSDTAFAMVTSADSLAEYFTVDPDSTVLPNGTTESTVLPNGATIIDIALDPTPGRSACFVLTSSSNGVYVHYYYRSEDSFIDRLGQLPNVKPFGGGKQLLLGPDPGARLHPLLLGEPSVVVTMTDSIWRVSPNDAIKFSLIDSANQNPTKTKLIQNVQFLKSGNLLFLTTSTGTGIDATGSNEIYLGDVNSNSLVSIKSNVPLDWLLWLDRFERFWLIKIFGEKTKEFFDRDTQLANAISETVTVPQCPFTIFTVEGDELFYPVDIGSTYIVVATLWYPLAKKVDLVVTVSLPLGSVPLKDNQMNTTILTDVQIIGDSVKVTRTISMQNMYAVHPVTNDPTPDQPKAMKSLMTTVTIRPSSTQPSCKKSQRVYFAQATCPAGLSIRLIPQHSCEANYPPSLTIPKEYYSNSYADVQPVEVLGNLLCDAPYYGDAYVPMLGLYYFGDFIENVGVDFYLFEVNWRTDFTYNTTQTEAGCMREAQDLEKNGATSDCSFDPVNIKTADEFGCWGPSKYKKCFSSPSDSENSASATKLYEILNSTGVNALLFPADHEPVYVFVAQILEPNYSFCNLATQFVVMPRGYGDEPDPLIPVYMFLASCVALFIFFWVIYWIYAVSWNENRVGFEMLQKQAVPRAWHLYASGVPPLLYTGSEGGRKVFVPEHLIKNNH